MSNDPCLNTALLNFCTSLSNGPRGENGTDSALQKRSPEELQWLKEALASIEQPERKIKRILEMIARENAQESECVAGLEELSDMVEDINWAAEFVLGGGHKIILDLLRKQALSAESGRVRMQAAMVVAHASQLNENVQHCFEKERWQEVLLPLLRGEEDPAVIAALLHSCSCLCRDYIPNAKLFACSGGIEIINGFLGRNRIALLDDNKIVKRALFFLAYLTDVIDVDVRSVVRHAALFVESDDDDVELAAARALTSAAKKSLSIVRAVLKEEVPNCLTNWRNKQLDQDDCRQQLVLMLEREGHCG
ncbi:hypothetical protein ERJ75_001425600 [Trypanosoma vivax]|uniref:Nucleotide exchange factor Fes1 domain-containing protein n=1 Tax=Trypanosoma vivax (strain Y486) TaxID=1055687 RepID=G0TUL6_TRYVY|nr:hypothetical protein TRVL_03979 [Trypanosoma vivax]KAH8606883.1 hypothetical protein ERJ75_001425600 [Trypanosoma vivax]CCC47651.1 conserved hypothetical protein [Trypanosoma vivax Y486]